MPTGAAVLAPVTLKGLSGCAFMPPNAHQMSKSQNAHNIIKYCFSVMSTQKITVKHYVSHCASFQRAAPEENKAVTRNFYGGPAKIYQFPTRNHLDAGRGREKTKTGENVRASNLATVRAAKIIFGSAWYHEEAVQETKGAGEN